MRRFVVILLIFLCSCYHNAGWVNYRLEPFLHTFISEAEIRGVEWNPYGWDFVLDFHEKAHPLGVTKFGCFDDMQCVFISRKIFDEIEFMREVIVFHEFGHLFYGYGHGDSANFIMYPRDFYGAYSDDEFREKTLDYFFTKW
jgi:hypothetical protein